MSITRSPRLAELRRREELADARKTTLWIGGLLAFASFSFVAWLTWIAT